MSKLYKIVAFSNTEEFNIKVVELPIEKETEKQIWIEEGHDDRRILKKQIGLMNEVWNIFTRVEFKTFATSKEESEKLQKELYEKLRTTVQSNLNDVQSLLDNIDGN